MRDAAPRLQSQRPSRSLPPAMQSCSGHGQRGLGAKKISTTRESGKHVKRLGAPAPGADHDVVATERTAPRKRSAMISSLQPQRPKVARSPPPLRPTNTHQPPPAVVPRTQTRSTHPAPAPAPAAPPSSAAQRPPQPKPLEPTPCRCALAFSSATRHPVFFTCGLRKPPFAVPCGGVQRGSPVASGYIWEGRRAAGTEGARTKL